MTRFLIDSNALMDAARDYYRMPNFGHVWQFMAENPSIFTVKQVFDELQRDPLVVWKTTGLNQRIVGLDADVLAMYQQLQEWIASVGYWTPAGFSLWAAQTKADPWLIATAAVDDFVLVTHERKHPAMDINRPTKQEPKITTVAEHFDVPIITVYEMLSELGYAES